MFNSTSQQNDSLSPRKYTVKGERPYTLLVQDSLEHYKQAKFIFTQLKDLDEQSSAFLKVVGPSYEIYKSALDVFYSSHKYNEDLSKTESSLGMIFKVNTEKSNESSQLIGNTLLSLGKMRESYNTKFQNPLVEALYTLLSDIDLEKLKDPETTKEELTYLHARVQYDHQEIIRQIQAAICNYWTLGLNISQSLENNLKSSAMSVAKKSDVLYRRQRIFGCSIYDGVEPLPPLIEKFFLYLEKYHLNEREIFIGTPNAGSIKKMTELIDKGTNFSKILNQDFETKGHVVASVLKTFVRMLPETILTTKLYKNFVDVGKINYVPERIQKLSVLVEQLPLRNKQVLSRYLRLFERILKQPSNEVTVDQLAASFGTNLLKQDDPDSIKDSPFIYKCVETLITCSNEMLPATFYKDSIKFDQYIISLMDQFYLDVGRDKSKKIFGVELSELHLIHVPETIERLMIFIERYYLKEPEILIKKGNDQVVQQLIKSIDKGTSFLKLFTKDIISQPKIAYSICDVIKHFAFSIPQSVLEKKYEAFIEASKIGKEKDRFEKFKTLIGELSIFNSNIIARYMRLFKRVIAFSKDNKVTLEDLAEEFGRMFAEPNLIPKSPEEAKIHPSTTICKFILLNGNLYFPLTQFPDTKFEDQDEDKKIIQSIRNQEEKRLMDAINNKDGKTQRKIEIFGVSLEKLSRPLPEILEKLMCVVEKYYLAEEGLFRIPSHLSSQKRLVEAIESDISLEQILETTMINRAHTICGTLKEFLRQLPEPILEIDKIDVFTSALKSSNINDKIAKLKELVDTHITEKGRILLARWMRLFERIILFSEKNRMTASSLAICLALNLVHFDDPTLSMTIAPKINKIFENIILYSDKLFPTSVYKETKYDDIVDPQIDSGDYFPLLVVDENEPFTTVFNELYEGPPGFDEEYSKSLEEQLSDLKRQESDKDVLNYLLNEDETESKEIQEARNSLDKLLGNYVPSPKPEKDNVKPSPIVHVINTKTDRKAPNKSVLRSIFGGVNDTKVNSSRDGEKSEKVKLEHQTLARPKQTGKREKSRDSKNLLDEMEEMREKEKIEPPKTFKEPEKTEPKKINKSPQTPPVTPITPELKKNFISPSLTNKPVEQKPTPFGKKVEKQEEKNPSKPIETSKPTEKDSPKFEKQEEKNPSKPFEKVVPKVETKIETKDESKDETIDEIKEEDPKRIRRNSKIIQNRQSVSSPTVDTKTIQNRQSVSSPSTIEKPAFTKRQNTKKSINTNNLDDITLKQIFQAMSSSSVLEMKERKSNGKTYPKSYTAFEIIEWLLWSYNITRKEALKIGQTFATKGLLTSVTDETTFNDSNDSYWST